MRGCWEEVEVFCCMVANFVMSVVDVVCAIDFNSRKAEIWLRVGVQ